MHRVHDLRPPGDGGQRQPAGDALGQGDQIGNDAFENDGLIERAREVGSILKERLTALQATDPRIGDVRGHGAMIAAEFVDPVTGEPDAALTAAVAKASIAKGVIVLTCGTYGNVIRFLPPLSIPDALLNEGIDVVAAALAAH